jgi:parallel beta helix pectate lyase-like protein
MTDYYPSANNKFLYNIVYNHPNGSCIFANSTGHMFFNNTCYNNRNGIYLYVSKTTPETGNIAIKNNIIANSARHHIVIEAGVQGPVELVSNEYFPDDAQKFNLSNSLADLAGWKAKTGQDVTSFAADPRFVAAVPAGPNDFRLQDGSPAIGKGAQTEFTEGLAADLKWPQVVRVAKQEQRWDLGAIQHGGGPRAQR